ncbi:MAG: putative porin [Acidobacteriota bacterium]|nr:putative porin [Acidobacteriota bacterium]
MNGLQEFLGEDLAAAVRVYVADVIRRQAEQQIRNDAMQAQAEAWQAANPTPDNVSLMAGGDFTAEQEAQSFRGLRQTLFITMTSQGAAPDMAWTRAVEAATFYVARCKDIGEPVGQSVVRGII